MRLRDVPPLTKLVIKHDIENLYMKGIGKTTLKSLSVKHGVPVFILAMLQKEIIKDILEKNKRGKHFDKGRVLLLGELGKGDLFIPKEHQWTDYANGYYELIKFKRTRVLVKTPGGKEELMARNLEVVLKPSL